MDEFKRDTEGAMVGAMILFCLACGLTVYDVFHKTPDELGCEIKPNMPCVAEVQTIPYVASEVIELGEAASTSLSDSALYKPSPWFKFQGEKGSVSVNVDTGEVDIQMKDIGTASEAGKVAAVIFWESFGWELKRICQD